MCANVLNKTVVGCWLAGRSVYVGQIKKVQACFLNMIDQSFNSLYTPRIAGRPLAMDGKESTISHQTE